MFIRISRELTQPYDLFSFHPIQLQTALDVIWEHARARFIAPPAGAAFGPALYDPGIGDRTAGARFSLRDELLEVLQGAYASKDLSGPVLADALDAMLKEFDEQPLLPRFWHHLIYAYLLENTRILQIFGKVLNEALHGERLGSISEEGHRWLRTTEELFFREAGFGFVASLGSELRPDPQATRRNAYYRMFAMDLNHGTLDNRPYPFVKAEAANREFVGTLERLLWEIWRGYINATNTSGPNTTDDTVIADLALKLQDMLGDRRVNGNLSREEYVAVSTLAWFHLTVSTPDAPIIADLKANASTPEERLRRLGERVGIAPHSKSRSLFLMAEQLSALLIGIEAGAFSSAVTAPRLYDPAEPNTIAGTTIQIVNHWSQATGRDLKALSVSVR